MQSYLRLKAFDIATEEGRGRERIRRATLTSLAAACSKFITMITPLVIIPLTYQYLGAVRYGLWMTVVSTVGMLTFADLGLGNGLLTRVSQSLGRHDIKSASQYISSAYFVLGLMGFIVLVSYFSITRWIPWYKFFNAPVSLDQETRGLVTAVVVSFAMSLMFGIVQRTQLACQEGFESNLWQCLGSIVALIGIIAFVKYKMNLSYIAFIGLAPAWIALILNTLVFFGYQRPELCPRWSMVNRSAAYELLRLGFQFLVLTILMTISLYSDNYIVARLLGIKAVAEFSIAARVANLLTSVPAMFFMPFWAAYGEAISRGDTLWVKRTTQRLLTVTLSLTTIAASLFVILGSTMMRFWIGKGVQPGFGLLLALGIWSVLLSITGPFFMVLNGSGRIRPQINMFVFFLPIALSMKILLANVMGVQGVVWGTVASYGFIILPSIISVSKLN